MAAHSSEVERPWNEIGTGAVAAPGLHRRELDSTLVFSTGTAPKRRHSVCQHRPPGHGAVGRDELTNIQCCEKRLDGAEPLAAAGSGLKHRCLSVPPGHNCSGPPQRRQPGKRRGCSHCPWDREPCAPSSSPARVPGQTRAVQQLVDSHARDVFCQGNPLHAGTREAETAGQRRAEHKATRGCGTGSGVTLDSSSRVHFAKSLGLLRCN